MSQHSIRQRASNEDAEETTEIPVVAPDIGNELRHLVEPQLSESIIIQTPSRALERDSRIRNVNHIGNLTVKDHFSLSNPSSTVAFAEDEAIVFVDNWEQVTMEKKGGNDYITAMQTTVSSPGLFLLRLAYTLVAFLMTGFIFVFCVQLILFLFLGLAIESGLTAQKGLNVFNFLGTLLSIPVFITVVSQAMVLANTFVIDTWKGSKFMKTMTRWDSIFVDWVTLFVFLGFPLCIASIALCTGSGHWWTITIISWFHLVFAYYSVFSICAVYYEIQGCLELVRYHPKLRENHDPDSNERTMITCVRAIKFRMKQLLSGRKSVAYFVHSTDPQPEELSYEDIHQKDSFQTFTGPISRLSRQKFMSKFFTVLDKPVREYSVDDILEFTPYITRSSWGLESVYCRHKNTRFVAVIDGSSALTKEQVRSNVACFTFGTLATLFAIVSALVWFKLKWYIIIVAVVLYALAVYRSIKRSIGLNNVYKSVLTREDGNERNVNLNRRSAALYHVQETFKITEPTALCRKIVLCIEIFFLFLMPVIVFFKSRNDRVGAVFIITGIITMIRNVFNAPSVLRELGSLEGLEVNNIDTDGTDEWREKHRLGRIVTEISVGKRSNFWIGVFLFVVVATCSIFVSAVNSGVNDGVTDEISFAPKEKFYYEGSKFISYASCSMAHNIKSPDKNFTNDIVDFAFLSNIAYHNDNVTNKGLDEWFGDTAFENLSENVTTFKESYQKENAVSSVSYKLLNFPKQDNLHIVSVRGTSNSWDILTDAQLWSSAALAQCVRAILPLGGLWTPIFPYLVKVVSMIEEKSLQDVSYYKETTAFVNSLKEKGLNVQIVGHSLGGGIAMITGAQTKTPAVGVSGPNNMISRETFHPEISKDDLNEYTFNIVPDRDPVPRIDDLAENYQHIQCTAAPHNFSGCHSAIRTICEVLNTCGSDKVRPIPCDCVHEYKYPYPTSVNGEDFLKYCPEPDP